jgi:structure-specific recognition protein 1
VEYYFVGNELLILEHDIYPASFRVMRVQIETSPLLRAFSTLITSIIMTDSKPTQFDDVYLNLSKSKGRLRLHTSGLGWKPPSGDPYTVPASDIRRAIWSHFSRGYSLKIILKNATSLIIDGFEESQADRVASAMKDHFDVVVENREHSLKGWNWGKAKFEGNELVFQVGARPGFEVPLAKVSNTNLVGKTEVAVELALQKEREGKEWEQIDELVEMRFYVPGLKEKDDDASDVEPATDEEPEDQSAAAVSFQSYIDSGFL